MADTISMFYKILELEQQVATLQERVDQGQEMYIALDEKTTKQIDIALAGCAFGAKEVERLKAKITTLTEALGHYAEDLRSVTWLSPVSAAEMNTRDRWLADELDKISESIK